MNLLKLRKVHLYISLVCAAPLLIMIISGIFLQLRNTFDFIQPSPQKLSIDDASPLISLEKISEIASNEKINQIIFSPKKKSLVIRLENQWEWQLHPVTGEIIQKKFRLSSLLIDIHQGSFFTDPVRYFIFIPISFLLIVLWLTGTILLFKKGKLK